MTKFTDYALDKNAVEFKKEFERVVSDKVNDTLDALRVHVASTMFTAPDIAEDVKKKGESHAAWQTRTGSVIAASDKRKKVQVTNDELEARARARRGEKDNMKEETASPEDEVKMLKSVHKDHNFYVKNGKVHHTYAPTSYVNKLRKALHTHDDKGVKLYSTMLV
jgi:hypothetical protein